MPPVLILILFHVLDLFQILVLFLVVDVIDAAVAGYDHMDVVEVTESDNEPATGADNTVATRVDNIVVAVAEADNITVAEVYGSDYMAAGIADSGMTLVGVDIDSKAVIGIGSRDVVGVGYIAAAVVEGVLFGNESPYMSNVFECIVPGIGMLANLTDLFL